MVRSGKVYLGCCRGLERGIAVEFGAVIARERVDRMQLSPQEGNRAAIHFRDGPRPKLPQHEVAGLPLDQAQAAVSIALGADDRIDFPIPEPSPAVDDGWALADRPFTREPAPAVVVAIPLAALFGAAAQVGVQAPARALIRPDVAVQMWR